MITCFLPKNKMADVIFFRFFGLLIRECCGQNSPCMKLPLVIIECCAKFLLEASCRSYNKAALPLLLTKTGSERERLYSWLNPIMPKNHGRICCMHILMDVDQSLTSSSSFLIPLGTFPCFQMWDWRAMRLGDQRKTGNWEICFDFQNSREIATRQQKSARARQMKSQLGIF